MKAGFFSIIQAFGSCLLVVLGGSCAGTDTMDPELLELGTVCSPDVECADTLVCKSLGGGGLCSLDCFSDAECELYGHCTAGLCAWDFGLVGDSCDDTPCHPGLDCLDTGQGAFCTRTCSYLAPCPEGEGALCVKLSNDAGTYCLKKCTSADECADELACMPLSAAPTLSTCFISL